ncbi:YciI family protein [Amycolatopsis sp. cg5]|uniref:YciI family protein n=1 Tax=Amycolatopsis sp. cg5 TaxID=3238802 RepID=UPI0035259701
MAWFFVEIRYVQEKFGEVRPRHREFLTKLADDGVVAVAGPLTDGTGGVTLYQAEDETALLDIINQDPYYLEGAVAERTIRGFNPVIGAWVPA